MPGIESLIYIIVYLMLAGLILYLAFWILGMLTLPQPVKHVILVIVSLVILIFILRALGLV